MPTPPVPYDDDAERVIAWVFSSGPDPTPALTEPDPGAGAPSAAGGGARPAGERPPSRVRAWRRPIDALRRAEGSTLVEVALEGDVELVADRVSARRFEVRWHRDVSTALASLATWCRERIARASEPAADAASARARRHGALARRIAARLGAEPSAADAGGDRAAADRTGAAARELARADAWAASAAGRRGARSAARAAQDAELRRLVVAQLDVRDPFAVARPTTASATADD